MPGIDLFPRSSRATNPYAMLAVPEPPLTLAPPLMPPATTAWAIRATSLARLLDEAEAEVGALWDGGLQGSEDMVRQALGYGMSDDPFFEANARTHEALRRLVARLGIVERKRKDLAVLLRWSERLGETVDDFLADFIPLEGRPLRWDVLDSACSAIVSRIVLLSARRHHTGPREQEVERRYAVQHVSGQINLLGWRFERLCHARAFLAAAASGLRAAQARHGTLLSTFHEDAEDALAQAARRCAEAAERVDAVLDIWAARIDQMEHELLRMQVREALLRPIPRVGLT